MPGTEETTSPEMGDGNSTTATRAKNNEGEEAEDFKAKYEKLLKEKKKIEAAKEKTEMDKEKIEADLEAHKAEKVVGMIEKIKKNGQFHSHLLYLTNWQANAISNSQSSVKRMIEIFHGKNKPRFIIHLVQSWGFYNSTKLMDTKHIGEGMSIGMEYGIPPFKDDDNFEEMNRTMARLTHFVSRVILPLAERTNALILCNAVADECILTETLMKVLKDNASRWDGGPMPFTVIKIMNEVDGLYKKQTAKGDDNEKLYLKNMKAVDAKEDVVNWTSFMEQSDCWKRRHSILDTHFNKVTSDKDKVKDWWKGHDLNWSLGDLVIVEGLDKIGPAGRFKNNYGPANLLLTRILDTYGKIPTLAIKTGATPRKRLECYEDEMDLMGWDYLVNRVNSETHVICLDVREKRSFENATTEDHKSIVSTGSEMSELYAISESIMKDVFGEFPKYENLDCCAVSRFGDFVRKNTKDTVHKEENDSTSSEKWEKDSLKDLLTKKRECKNMEEGGSTREINPKKQQELDIQKLSQKFVRRFREQFEKDESEEEQLGKDESGKSQFGEKDKTEEHKMVSNIEQLLMSELFHCKTIWDHEEDLEKYIDENILFKYHRPHSVVPFEGLKLLESAWEYVDKTRTDATGYRIVCIGLFLLQLVLGVLITIFTATFDNDSDEDTEEVFKNVTLVTTLLLTAVVSIDSLLSPKLMWRQLRLASVELESLIWQYRAGVGDFDPGLDTLRDAEDNFDKAFTRWKENLHNTLNNVGGTTIPQSSEEYYFKTSALPKVFTNLVFGLPKDRKWTSYKINEETHDNHYSYVLSQEYLKMRLDELLKIYRSRLPKRVWKQQKWQLMIIVLGIVIAFVTETNFGARSEAILILTALAAALSSWSGFVDLQGDSQLYPPAINALRNKKMEWEKRIKHQQQDLELFEDLVLSVENVALNVVESWSNSLSATNTNVKSPGNKGGSQSNVPGGPDNV